MCMGTADLDQIYRLKDKFGEYEFVVQKKVVQNERLDFGDS